MTAGSDISNLKSMTASVGVALREIDARITAAVIRAGRTRDSVKLVAISKLQENKKIEAAFESGQRAFGENYVQEALGKKEIFQRICPPAELHFVGHLQSNKVKQCVGYFDLIQTVDRPKLAKAIAEAAEKVRASRPEFRQHVLVQINISGEASKSGCAPQDAEALCALINSFSSLKLGGLMTIGRLGAAGDNHAPDTARDEFKRLASLRSKIETQLGIALPELSMGMSEDFEIAVEEGATIVRVGTAIFGSRKLEN